MKNQIEIKGITIINLKKALKNWINEYSESLNSKLKFEIFNQGRNHQIIVFENELETEHFFFLVNYLEFHDNKEYEVKGNLKVINFNVELDNKKLLVYISKSDTEYDNVYAVTEENQNYKINFGGKITKILSEATYSEIIDKTGSTPHLVKIEQVKKKEIDQKTSISRKKKRFNIIFIIFLSLNFIYFLLPFFTRETKMMFSSTFIISTLTFIWFFGDEKMLRTPKFYLKSLLVGTLFIGLSELFRKIHNFEFSEIPSLFYFLPISFLIVQYPTRMAYTKIFNREPKIDRTGRFSDMIYALIVVFFPIFISGMIYDYFK